MLKKSTVILALMLLGAALWRPSLVTAQDTPPPAEAAATAPAEAAPPPAEAAPAAPAGPSTEELSKQLEELKARTDAIKFSADTVWTMIAGFLVFFMNAGFALVESGFCRKKNAATILGKNFVVFGAATLAYWVIGFSLMFGEGSGFLGSFTPFIGSEELYAGSLGWANVALEGKFFFQLAFAGTAATIVSGCVDERNKYLSFVVFAFLLTALVYPIPGKWIWGAGWLAGKGFWDFAGSTVVHSVGGWAGLAGILVIGPRIGKYSADGKANAIPAHSIPLVVLGTLILWLGWFGFNPGSTMTWDGASIAHIAMTTNIAAVAGMATATAVAWITFGKPDLGMSLNGCLAGLVAVTAPCAWVTAGGAFVIGAVGGVLCFYSVLFWDKLKIDDPVGALSVHLANGIWGTLCVGLFAAPAFAGGEAQPGLGLFYGGGAGQLINQIIGIVSVAAFAFPASLAVWYAVKAVMGVRVSEEEEVEGLDLKELGIECYVGDTLHGSRG